MADFAAELATIPTLPGEALIMSWPAEQERTNTAGTPTVTHYKLRAHRTSDNTWQYWVDTAIQITNAPGGSGNYNAATLTVEAKF